MPNAILFDLDNTLVDRAASLARYAEFFHRDFGTELDVSRPSTVYEAIVAVDGGGYHGWDAIFTHLLDVLPWQTKPTLDTLHTHRHENYVKSAIGMAGLHETLRELQARPLKLGIITNGSQHSQQGKIDLLEIAQYMAVIVISGEVGIKKPDARIFEIALSELSVSAKETWFVGDHPVNDMAGAVGVGLIPVWRRGFHEWPSEYSAPKYQIDALSQVLSLV